MGEVFISYAWGGESETIADILKKTFQDKGIKLVRGKSDLGYKGSIREFMQQLGQGKCVVAVISDQYLKSENCMYELLEISRNGEFYDRIFPVVLKDAKIYDVMERLNYIKYWEGKIKELEEGMRGVSLANLQGFREEIDLYTEIRNKIAGLVDTLQNMNALTLVMHQETGYEKVVEAITRRLNEDARSHQNNYEDKTLKNSKLIKKKLNFVVLMLPRTRPELCYLGLFLFLSLLPPVQDLLLELRLFAQAYYRQITNQVLSQVESPLLLVQIDNNSLNHDKVDPRKPINYSYLSKLVEKASKLETKIVGIDYVLDEDKVQPENSQKLSEAIRQAKEIRFIFAAINSQNPNRGSISKRIVSIDSKRYQVGKIEFFPWYVELPDNSNNLISRPFAYLLALNYSCLSNQLSEANELKLSSEIPNDCSLVSTNNGLSRFVYSLNLLHISRSSQWFQPIIDFSIPPNSAYKTVSACEFLETCSSPKTISKTLQSKIVLIAPGGYEEAGVHEAGGDNYTIPLAVKFWQGGQGKILTGGEAHAYMIHHFLTKRLVVPIPDFLMVLLAALLGKGVMLILLKNPSRQKFWIIRFSGITAVYGWISLQVFISAGLLIPLFFPSAVFWNYVRLTLRRQTDE